MYIYDINSLRVNNYPMQVASSCEHDKDTSGFLKMRRDFRLAGELLASYKRPCSVEVVNK